MARAEVDLHVAFGERLVILQMAGVGDTDSDFLFEVFDVEGANIGDGARLHDHAVLETKTDLVKLLPCGKNGFRLQGGSQRFGESSPTLRTGHARLPYRLFRIRTGVNLDAAVAKLLHILTMDGHACDDRLCKVCTP